MQADANVVKALKKEYLLRIFGERDAEKRRSLIAKISDRKGIFIDPRGRYVGQTAVNDVAGQPERSTPSAMEYRMGGSATVGVSRLFRYSHQLVILALLLSFAVQAATQKVNQFLFRGRKPFQRALHRLPTVLFLSGAWGMVEAVDSLDETRSGGTHEE